MHGKAPLLAILMITASFGSVATVVGEADEVHDPIQIIGDDELKNNTCECISNPGATGSETDPFIIEDWRISNSGGPAIDIRDITSNHFVIRDNTLSAEVGVNLKNTGDRGEILRNTINYERRGVNLVNSATFVADNKIRAETGLNWWGNQAGVRIDGSAPTIKGNEIRGGDTGIVARSSSPTIELNKIIGSQERAVLLTESTEARLESNIVHLAQHWGLVVKKSAQADVVDNEIREGQGGIIVDDATLYMVGNKVINQRADAVRFTDSVVTMLHNNISANWRGAFGSTDSDVQMRGNLMQHNENAAIRLTRSEGTVEENTILDNGVGIRLDDSRIALHHNVVNNNTLGLSIPYSAKGSIQLMKGNIVNGLNVDGTVEPDEQRIFYRAFGVEIRDEHFDSNHSENYTGTLTAQGALIIYDSVNVTVANSTFDFQKRGMTVHNGSLVRVRGNVFANIEAQAVLSIDSKIFIKENECEIDIDPPEPVCFETRGGSARIRLNVIANVSIGIKLGLHNGDSTIGVVGENHINHTSTAAIHARATRDQTEHELTIEGNVIARANVVGMVLVDFQAVVDNNTVVDSTWAGIQLKGKTNATFSDNRIEANVRGVVDVGECHDSFNDPCSGGVFIDNEIRGNAEVGVELDGGGSFTGDLVVDNGIGIHVRPHAHLSNVTVEGNADVGIQAVGRVGVHDSNVSANGDSGVHVRGVLIADNTNASDNERDGFHVRGHARTDALVAIHNEGDGADVTGTAVVGSGNFSLNGRSGLRFTGVLFVVEDCDASFNDEHGVVVSAGVDVNIDADVTINPPPIPDVDPDFEDEDDQDPLFIHDCDIAANEEFALKASQETIVNATANFWGHDGPTYDLPLFRTGNVISDHVVLVSPYWKTRAHEDFAFLPTTEAGPDEQVA